jgi:non-specific serine/threonine protein kinase/serine/threonine-protein kinase
MGEVFLAEQRQPLRRRVAVKVIKRGMDTKQVVARFESERQALALMDHPCIARVLDAGSTEQGRPYFVMEYVNGEPINRHCDRYRLSMTSRLELFMRVCDGVQHAHQKGVIHRDIKPSNVLVKMQAEEAVPTIIDFGVAKAIQQRLTEQTLFTQLGVLIGTPEYMSPEQADPRDLDVDTRTDVYSLGVLLYELLVGALPFDARALRRAGIDEIRRRIREDEPSRPSARIGTLGGKESVEAAERRGVDLPTLRRQLRGDLDWIAIRALEKDRARRYQSPSELAEDIRRHLRDEPVMASPPSLGYRAGKFVRRNKIGVGTATAAMLTLIAFAATMTVQTARIARERNRANREAEASTRVSGFLADMLGGVDAERLGGTLLSTLRVAVQQGLEDQVTGEDATSAALVSFDAAVRGVNATDVARRVIDAEILGRAVETIDSELSEDPLVAARLRHTVGRVYRLLGLLEPAEQVLRQALATRRELLGEEHPETLASMLGLARVFQQSRRHEEAEVLYRERVAVLRRLHGEESKQTLRAMTDLANSYQLQGQQRDGAQLYAAAEELLLEVLETHRRAFGEEDVFSTFILGIVYSRQNEREDEAARLLSTALDAGDDIEVSPSSTTWPDVARIVLGEIHHSRGRFDEAERLYREVLKRRRRIYGVEHRETLIALSHIAFLHSDQARWEEAERLHLDALEKRRRVLGDDHVDTLGSIVGLAAVYKQQGRYDEAESLYREALDTQKRVLGDDHPDTVNTMSMLSGLYEETGKLDEARLLVVELLDWRKKAAEAPNSTASAKNAYAWELLGNDAIPADLRDPRTALKFALEANEMTGFEKPAYLDTLAVAYHRTGDTAKAVETQEKAISLLPADSSSLRSGLEKRLVEFEAALKGDQ